MFKGLLAVHPAACLKKEAKYTLSVNFLSSLWLRFLSLLFPCSLLHSGGGCCPKMLPRCRRVRGSWSSTPCRGHTAPTCSSLPPTPFSMTRPPSSTVRHTTVWADVIMWHKVNTCKGSCMSRLWGLLTERLDSALHHIKRQVTNLLVKNGFKPFKGAL